MTPTLVIESDTQSISAHEPMSLFFLEFSNLGRPKFRGFFLPTGSDFLCRFRGECHKHSHTSTINYLNPNSTISFPWINWRTQQKSAIKYRCLATHFSISQNPNFRGFFSTNFQGFSNRNFEEFSGEFSRKFRGKFSRNFQVKFSGKKSDRIRWNFHETT